MNVTHTPVESISKAFDTIEGSGFQLEEITSIVERKPVKPGLLTALIGGPDVSMTTDTYKFDKVSKSVVLPGGKSYTENGPDVPKTGATQHRVAIGSYGLRSNVLPGDYSGRRKPGTQEFLSEADVVADMDEKVQIAWDLSEERQWASLLTTDTNLPLGGPVAAVDWWAELESGARPAARNMDLGTATTSHEVLFRNERLLGDQQLARSGDSASGWVVICTNEFFDARYEIEKNVGLARPLQYGVDLASDLLPELNMGGFKYAMFHSYDGLTYINYGSEIIAGTKLLPTAGTAFMVPIGTQKLFSAGVAPAQTRSYVNTPGLGMYTWSNVHERNGVTVFTERNVLHTLHNPSVIRYLDDGV